MNDALQVFVTVCQVVAVPLLGYVLKVFGDLNKKLDMLLELHYKFESSVSKEYVSKLEFYSRRAGDK